MKATRQSLAMKVIRGLCAQSIGESVFLRGSLARCDGDSMSDIDIGIRDDQNSDQALASLVIKHMEKSHDVLFYDWARSLLPETCVLTFFFKDHPLFWHVDIELLVDSNKRVLTRDLVTNNRKGHLLKLWIVTAKHTARGDPSAYEEVDRLYRSVVNDGDESIDLVSKLQMVLTAIETAKPSAYLDLIAQCHRFQRKLEALV